MRDWLSIPILHNALWVLAAGVIIPLIFGIVARIFFKRDEDDEQNNPDEADELRERSTGAPPDTPEPQPVNEEPWPSFDPSSKTQI
jgi:hypothetical protein